MKKRGPTNTNSKKKGINKKMQVALQITGKRLCKGGGFRRKGERNVGDPVPKITREKRFTRENKTVGGMQLTSLARKKRG